MNFASQFEDPSKSKVAGKVGYAVLPAGPVAHIAPTYTNAMAVSAQSRNKEAAYLFIQWATTKKMCVRELLSGVGVSRVSPWSDPEVKAKPKMPVDCYTAYLESLKIGRAGLPEIVDVTEYRDIIGVAIQKAIEGAKSEVVLADANKQFQELLDQTEKWGHDLTHEASPASPRPLSGARRKAGLVSCWLTRHMCQALDMPPTSR